MRGPSLCFVLLLLVPGSAAAQEDALAAALAAYDSGQLDVALARFEEALARPGNGPEELARIHLHLGILRGSTGDLDGARRGFERALALRPDLEPPAELGPDLVSAFETAREARGGRALGVRIDSEARPRGATHVEVTVAEAPADLVTRLRLSAGPWAREADGAAASFDVPAAAWRSARELELLAEALDAHGGVAARATRRLRAPAPAVAAPPAALTAPAPEEEDEEPGRRRAVRSPWLWIAVGVVAATGITVGVVLATADDQYVVTPTGP